MLKLWGFLKISKANIRGLLLPMGQISLLDVEFVDDTKLYVEGTKENLD